MVTVSDFPWMEKVLISMGYRRGLENPNFIKFHHVTYALEDVDVMLVNEQTFEKLWAASGDFQRGSALLRVPAPLHLIALKLHAIKSNPERLRKDLNDILELVGRNQHQVDAGSLREACDKYGPPGIFDQIQAILK
jgi:hypothetical protein